MGKWKYEKLAVYSIYKGDCILFTGTIQECADFLGVSIVTAKFYTTPSQVRRTKNNGTIIVRIDGDDDYEDL